MSSPDSGRHPVRAQMQTAHATKPSGRALGAQQVLQQLQLHQIELERQNEALREVQFNLAAERARYIALFDLAPVAYLTVSAVGVILQVNLAAASLLGVERNRLQQRPFSAFMPREGSDTFYLLSQRLLATGAPETGEVSMRRPGGTPFTAQLTCVTTQGAGGALELLIIMEDMSARKQSQERRVRAQALEATSQAKSRFLVAASHDLRQPTHAMGMFIARLAQLPQAQPTRHLVDCLEASVRTLQDMLENLFDVSRFGTGSVQVRLRPFPVDEVFDQLRDAFACEALDKGLHLQIRKSPAWLQCDPVLLHRILFNLVSNAVRYTAQGSVLVACRPAGGGSHARIEVWDSGVGIAEQHHDKIFEEFYQVGNQARDRAKGLGLGLSIVAHTCQLLSLPLAMRSTPGLGTRFTLQIPRTQALPEWLPAMADMAHVADRLRGLHMLVIEDDDQGREALASLLVSWGCSVTAANGPQDACERLRAAPLPDVIISDYRLRDGHNGIDAVQQVRRALGRQVAACLISGDTDLDLAQRAQAAGFALLHKPVRPAKLRSLLSRLCQHPAP